MLTNQDFSVNRTKYIGGSDIGAILGLSKYKTPLEVWMEKTGKETKAANSLPLRFGSFAEEFVAREYASATASLLLHDESMLIHPELSFMSAHIDRFVLGDGKNLPPTKILECKTANPFAQQEWGEAGSDQVPMGYLAQCIWYMAITNIERTDLAVLFGNNDFRIYHIERDRQLETLVLEKANNFWINHVLSDIPPSMQTTTDYQALFSKEASGKTVEAQENIIPLLSQFHSLKEEIDCREKQIDEIKQSIMAQMKDAEILTYQDKVLATWKTPKPSYRFDSKRFQTEHPELYPLYQLPIANSRRLVLKESCQAQQNITSKGEYL